MKFAIGDIISFLNETGTGEVVQIKDFKVLVLNEYGFEDWYDAKEVVPRQFLKITNIEKKDEPISRQGKSKNDKPNELIKDLHFGELVDFPKNFTRHEMVQIQLKETRATIEKAKRAGIKKIVLIHGVGEGRLREEIHTMLERMDRLTFYDGNYARFGSGATEVELF